MFYAMPTARVIFTAKTSLDIFSLRREHIQTLSVLGNRIYEMRCPFVAVGLNALFTWVLPHWDNMSYAHMLTHPVTLINWHRADQLCFVVPASSWVPCKQGPLPFFNVLVWPGPGTNRESNPQNLLVSAGSPYRRLSRSTGATEGLYDTRELHQQTPPWGDVVQKMFHYLENGWKPCCSWVYHSEKWYLKGAEYVSSKGSNNNFGKVFEIQLSNFMTGPISQNKVLW